MADKRRPALGRGMAALLSNAPPPPSAAPPALPRRGAASCRCRSRRSSGTREQPRKRFDEAKLEELAASIREHGVVEPILVRSEGAKYRIVAGERRWRAAQRAGLREIPALVREASDREAFEIALDREPPARRPERDRGGRGVRGARPRARPHPGGDRASGSARSARRSRTRSGCSSCPARSATRSARASSTWATPGRCSRSTTPRPSRRRPRGRSGRSSPSGRPRRSCVSSRGGTRPSEPKGDAVRDAGRARPRAAPAAPAGRAVPGRAQVAVAGRLEVEYTSLDELDGILAKIGV